MLRGQKPEPKVSYERGGRKSLSACASEIPKKGRSGTDCLKIDKYIYTLRYE